LHFSINLSLAPPDDPTARTNRRENFLPAYVPGTPLAARGPAAYQDYTNYYAQWGEIAYFLRALPATTTSGSAPLGRYALYRRQLAVLSQSDADYMNTDDTGLFPRALVLGSSPNGWATYYE